jgi:hypothetical protein
VAAFGRDHEGAGEGEGLVQLVGQARRTSALTRSILLIASATGLPLRHFLGDAVDDGLDALGQAAMRLDQEDHDVGIGGPAPGGLDHAAVQPAARAEDARRVDEDDLALPGHADAADTRAGGLHLVRDDGDLGPHHAVQQRGLAGVGFSDQGNEAGAGISGHLGLDWGTGRAHSASGPKRPVALAGWRLPAIATGQRMARPAPWRRSTGRGRPRDSAGRSRKEGQRQKGRVPVRMPD